MVEVLRKSKFFAVFYGDAIAEKEFYAKNFSASLEKESAEFSLELMHLLDYKSFHKNLDDFDSFVLEDAFLQKKLTTFLKENKHLKFFKLRVVGKKELQVRLARIKFDSDKVCFYTN